MAEGSSNALPVVPFIHEVLIEEILVRLPVKSLLRFRCVSKSWCCLISSKDFIQFHLQYSKKKSGHSSSIDLDSLFRWIVQFDSLLTHDNQPQHHIMNGDEQLRSNQENIYYVKDCCNGLCLISSKLERMQFYLWNPFTRRHKKLPDVWPRKDLKHLSFGHFGFGFDESNDDYKVVIGVRDRRVLERRAEDYYTVKVYSLKADSWKRMNKFDGIDFVQELGRGQRVKGKLYWISYLLPYKIIWFDLASEVRGMIKAPQPDIIGDGLTPMVLGGCLCLGVQKTDWSIWVLREAGSWVRVYEFKDSTSWISRAIITGDAYFVLVKSSDGKTQLVDYDPETNSLKFIEVNDSLNNMVFYLCVQSLISPFPESQQQQKNVRVISKMATWFGKFYNQMRGIISSKVFRRTR